MQQSEQFPQPAELQSPELPLPPTQFGGEQWLESSGAQDALGGHVVRNQVRLINTELEVDDIHRNEQYWRDMREFYAGDDEANQMSLNTLAEARQLPEQAHRHIQETSVGSYTLALVQNHGMFDAITKETHIANGRKNLAVGLGSIRETLRERLDNPAAHGILQQYMEDSRNEVPALFEDLRGANDGVAMSWEQWLTEKADDAQLMNFMQWHNHRMQELNQDPAIEARIMQQLEEYEVAVHRLVKDAWPPLEAHMFEDKVMRDLRRVKVHIGDVFSTTMREYGGYYPHQPDQNERYVIVGIDNVENATKHELNHAVLGSFKDRWLDEATTEHVAVAMEIGEMKTIIDASGQGVCNEERDLLDVVMTEGAEIIPMDDLLKGYTEQKTEGAKDTFEQAVDKAWGQNALQDIGLAVSRYEGELKRKGHSEFDAQRRAVSIVRSDLFQQPHKIFGADYIKPPSHQEVSV